MSDRGDEASDVTTRPSATIRRIQIGCAETLAWVVAAIALPFAPFLDPVRETLQTILEPIGRYPIVAGLAFLVVLGLLTWAARAHTSGTSVRAWIAGAWFAGMVMTVILVFIGLRQVEPSLFTLFLGVWIVLGAWILVGIVVSPLIMLGAIALATSRFVVRLPAEH